MRRIRAFARDQHGVAAVEFALIAPVMFVLIMGAIELGVTLYAKAQLDGVLRTAARMAVTGDEKITGEDGVLIDAYVRRAAPMVGGADVSITKEFYDKFSSVRKPEKKSTNNANPPYCFDDINNNQRWDENPSRTGLGGPDDIINYKVKLEYPPLFPLITSVVTKSEKVTLTSQITLRNEPFGGGADAEVKTCCVSAASGNPVTCS